MLKASELRDQTKEEIEARLLEAKKELYTLKCEIKKYKKAEKPHLLKERKKDIAKLLTVLVEKESEKS